MYIKITQSIKVVYQVMQNKCTQKYMQNGFEFKQLLMILNTNERILLGLLFRKMPWNIGSLRVLRILQDLMILTATQFIMSLEDEEEIQLMLNDFLEDEYDLLMNLFTSAHYNRTGAEKINLMLIECLRRLFNDLLKNPKLNNLNYLQHLQKAMTEDYVIMLMKKHIDTVLVLQLDNIKECFRNFTYWIGDDSIQFNKQLYDKLLGRVEIATLSYIFKASSVENFAGWKFYLILLHTITSNCCSETTTFIKKHLKTRLNEIAMKPSERDMQHLLLSARAAMAQSTTDIERNINSYADWYKQNICDMKFVLSTIEFQNVLEMLQKSVDYEMETYYLEIHAAYNISPPVYFGKQVQSYKSKCKVRLEQLKKQVTHMEI